MTCFEWLYYNYIVSNCNQIIIIINVILRLNFFILNDSMESEVFSK